jgi:hypothetical protein
MAMTQVTLTWTKVMGALGYRIYRSPMADGGAEQLIGTVGDVATYTDMGAMPMMGTAPLPAGSVGNWSVLAKLGTARQSPSVAIAPDPAMNGTFYLYAFGGSDGMNKPLASYEYLPITVAMNGQQTAAMAWKAGANPLAKGRSLAGAWTYASGGFTTIYVGGGQGVMAVEPMVEVGKVAAGGDLGMFADCTASIATTGFATVAAGPLLMSVGDDVPDKNISMATVSMDPMVVGPFAVNGTMGTARYLCGAALDGPTVFAVGGSTMGKSSANKSTEWMVY